MLRGGVAAGVPDAIDTHEPALQFEMPNEVDELVARDPILRRHHGRSGAQQGDGRFDAPTEPADDLLPGALRT